MTMNELKRNFFYKKTRNAQNYRKNAFWVELNGCKYLVSYQTVVAGIDSKGYFHKFWDDYSATTQNHINSFFNVFRAYNNMTGEEITGLNKKEWIDYPYEQIDETVYKQLKPLFPEIEWNYSYRYDYVKKISYS